jgi:hypothetical protein
LEAAAGYSGTPLPRKLGIRADSRVLLVSPPRTLDLDPLPSGVVLHRRAGGAEPYDVIVAFCPDQRAMRRRFAPLVQSLVTAGALWVCWPKKASGVPTDLSERVVREHGLGVGLVDVKVAAIDQTWSGLKFVRRLRDR